MVTNRACLCCSTKYSYCPNCGSDKLKESWYAQFCSKECKELWSAATKFNMKLIDKSEAKNIISSLNLKDHSEYVTCVQRDLTNILAEEPKPKRSKKSEITIVNEICDIATEAVNEIITESYIDESHEVVEKEN